MTSLNLRGNDLNGAGVGYIGQVMAENTCITELVSVTKAVTLLYTGIRPILARDLNSPLSYIMIVQSPGA